MATADEALTPLMQRVRAQAEVLVPLLRQLRAKLGPEAANALVYPVLRMQIKSWTAQLAVHDPDDPVGSWQKAVAAFDPLFAGDVDVAVVRQEDKVLDVDVTGCRYADFFRRIGEPELGTILVCELDNHIAARSAPAVALSRSGTIMTGAAICPFHYRFKTDLD